MRELIDTKGTTVSLLGAALPIPKDLLDKLDATAESTEEMSTDLKAIRGLFEELLDAVHDLPAKLAEQLKPPGS